MPVFYPPSASATAKLANSKTLTASNATAAVPIFRITGRVKVLQLYGIVTTALGANHTGGYFRMNDQTAQADITLNTVGVTMSAFVADSWVGKTALPAVLASIKNASTGGVLDPVTAGLELYSPFDIVKKSGANTDIEYVYTTTNTPTSGVIQFFVEYVAQSADGAIAAV